MDRHMDEDGVWLLDKAELESKILRKFVAPLLKSAAPGRLNSYAMPLCMCSSVRQKVFVRPKEDIVKPLLARQNNSKPYQTDVQCRIDTLNKK
jgi:hypothetical protein